MSAERSEFPPIFDPPFKSSEAASSIYDEKVVDYEKLDAFYKEQVYNDDLKQLGTSLSEDITEYIQSINEIISNPTFNEMEASSDPKVLEFINFIRQAIPYKSMMTISQTWPAVIPKSHSKIEPLVHLLLRMANESQSPEKFIRWMCNNIPPKKWVKHSTSSNAELVAMCPAVVDGQGPSPHWVCLDVNFILHVYNIVDGACDQVIEEKAARIAAGEDKKVVIFGISGQEICKFKPLESKLAKLWTFSFDKKRASFPMFMMSFVDPIPMLVYKAYAAAFKSVDCMMTRAIIRSNIFPDNYKLAESLLTVFSYEQSVDQLISTMVIDCLDTKDITVYSSIDDKKAVFSLFQVFIDKFGKDYINGFLRKLIIYIDSSEELNIEDMENVNEKAAEKVFFTVIKYILDSSSFISNEIRQFISYVKEYSTVRFNNLYFTYNCIAQFFGIKYICNVLEYPTKYIPDLTLNKPGNVHGICRLLRIAFKLGTMSGPYEKLSSFNKRLTKHVYPKLIMFVFSVGEIIEEDITYEVPTDKEFSNTVTFLAQKISERHKPLMKVIESLKKADVIPGLLGYNLTTAISNFFVHKLEERI